MRNRLRVLQYNVQMRSWGMEAGAQGTLTPTTSVEERANLIADRVLAARDPWDVLCFDEVFDEDGREVLAARLRHAYPHYVLKADADNRGKGLLELAGGLALSGSVIGIGLGLLGAVDLLAARWEDSGLMLFSKHPFAPYTFPPGVEQAAADAGFDLTGFPAVAYVPYEDAVQNDKGAAKGVVYAQIVLPSETPFHLMISHTQSDTTDHIGQNWGTRKKQFSVAMGLLREMLGTPPPHEPEILFCGDFNVQGMRDENGERPEWAALFDTPGSPLTDVLQDAWWFEQCPGRHHLFGMVPLPDDCDPGPTVHRQRLDYLLRPRRRPGTELMVAQHIRIAHDVAQAPPGTSPTLYTSDHLPLSLDLNQADGINTVLTADRLALTVAAPEYWGPQRTLSEGVMHWYRIDDPGGFGFALHSGASKVEYAVYTSKDLSVPYQPFTTTVAPPSGEGPAVTRYAMAERPFLVRVFLRRGVQRAQYRLYARRFVGTGQDDAIPLLRAWPAGGEARVNAPHSGTNPSDPDFDSVWFSAPLEAMPPGIDSVHHTVTLHADNQAFGLRVYRDDGGGGLDLLGDVGAGNHPATVEFDHDREGWLFILARREDPSFSADSFILRHDADVTYLYSDAADPRGRPLGGDARLFCVDETDGFLGSESGADDIEVNVSVAGHSVVHIPHTPDLDFDDDTLRDLVMPTVGYRDAATVELVELDDLSPDDRASVAIPPLASAPAVATAVTGRDGPRIRAVFSINFGDGRYELETTLSPEPPAGP